MDDAVEFYLERAAITQFDGGEDLSEATYGAVCRTRIYCERKKRGEPALDAFAVYRLTALEWSDEEDKPVYGRETVTGRF